MILYDFICSKRLKTVDDPEPVKKVCHTSALKLIIANSPLITIQFIAIIIISYLAHKSRRKLIMKSIKKLSIVQKNKESCTFLSFLTDFVICFLLHFLYARVRKCLFFCSDIVRLCAIAIAWILND